MLWLQLQDCMVVGVGVVEVLICPVTVNEVAFFVVYCGSLW